jgi:XRE family aerobic/anaerobic benzoate catabolism transcriptional regulator
LAAFHDSAWRKHEFTGFSITVDFWQYSHPQKALTETLADFKTCVIEVGGSIVVNQDSFKLLLSSCCVVWIRALPEQHMQRVIDQGDLRPMAGNEDAMSDLKRILQEREPFYTRAHYSSGHSGSQC